MSLSDKILYVDHSTNPVTRWSVYASTLPAYKYEGRSINKLQNDIILLIFKIWKFGNIRFVLNLIEDI